MEKTVLLGKKLQEVQNLIVAMGEKKFRAEQIVKGLWAGLSFSEITGLPSALRARLSEEFIDLPTKIIKTLKSADGTEKFLFGLCDGQLIEGVLMKYKYGCTLCVSTQVGCRMGCAFCASGLDGLLRNLTAEEILGEVVAANAYAGGGTGDKRKIINVVLMGSGEPLDNYEEVVRFLRLLSDKEGLNVSPRNVSLSTSGLVPKMYDLANEGLPVNLTVSLHAAFDDERQKIMPVAKRYSIKEILAACENYFEKTGRRYIFEYVLIKGENDDARHAEGLIDLLKGKPCHVNLIRLNEVKERTLKGGSEKEAYRFLGMLERGGLSATLRRRMGEDIDGACGQLRRRYIEECEK